MPDPAMEKQATFEELLAVAEREITSMGLVTEAGEDFAGSKAVMAMINAELLNPATHDERMQSLVLDYAEFKRAYTEAPDKVAFVGNLKADLELWLSKARNPQEPAPDSDAVQF